MKAITVGAQELANDWAMYAIRRKFLFVPAAVIEDSKLSAQAKILFITINSFTKKFGYCFAGNDVLSGKIGLKKTMLKKYIKELKDNRMIDVTLQPAHKHPRKIYINVEELMMRYPKLPVEVPASCKLSGRAAKIFKKK